MKRPDRKLKGSRFPFWGICLFLLGCQIPAFGGGWKVEKGKDHLLIRSGIMERELSWSNHHFVTRRLMVKGKPLNDCEMDELRVSFLKAIPNEAPKGLKYSAEGGIEQSDAIASQTDALVVKKAGSAGQSQVKWIDSLSVTGANLGEIFNRNDCEILNLGKGLKQVKFVFSSDVRLKGISMELFYELRQGAIRKWVKINNKSSQWYKISDLQLEQLRLMPSCARFTPLTPGVRGLDPSIAAFSDSSASAGIIMASEVPSKLRQLSADGSCGYNPGLFEWVLAPGEYFESEPVFLYAFTGKVLPTASAISTPLDRCVEGNFHRFLNNYILRKVSPELRIAPVFCTWTNYGANINEKNMYRAADIASRIGFRCFQLDAGWSDTGPEGGWAVSSPEPDKNKFPDFRGLCDDIRSKNMQTGLWYSVFVNAGEARKASCPDLFSIPLVKRAGGLGLSLCAEKSRSRYVNDVVLLNKTYHARYFKQDLSNICYGDQAEGHESRTMKESYLRGLRGLFAMQDDIHRQVPGVWLQLSHEIYWETPGPEADIAVLKHADSYHSAPNEYWGAGNRSKPVSPAWKFNPDSLRLKLIEGAFRARKLLYAHRGLPLNRIEVFGAVTTNFEGSLTPAVQDRQICSWLMGAPVSFSGDLESLSEENITRYQNRFGILDYLQKKYDIYSHFQYSGVPGPTDEGWHWWGKLNENGCGAVVVLRGCGGPDSQIINIPWVIKGKRYQLKAWFSGKNLGYYSGRQLINGSLTLSLDRYGQEIIEISPE